MSDSEAWKYIPGYEGLYEASTHGRIRTVEGKVTHTNRHGERRWKSRVMKGRGDRHSPGKRVSLWKDGSRKDYLVARLIALTFLGEPQQGFTVNHKDGDRMNNRIENLEWLSSGDNTRHAFQTGLMHNQIAVVLETEGTSFEFRSMAEASRFLGRKSGYLSGQLKRGHKVTCENGTCYAVVLK